MKKLFMILSIVLVLGIFTFGCSFDISIEKEKKGETDAPTFKEGQELKVYYFDVGQGDSIYVKGPNGEDILIDAGDNKYGETVVEYLKELKVDDIEVMIATHPHSDHIGGLDIVMQSFEVETVYAPKVTHTSKTYEDFLNAVIAEGLKIKNAKAGVEIPLEGIRAEFVGPVQEHDDLNDWSAVLHLTFGKTSFIFTGDAESKAEKDILDTGKDVQSDVLKVGHHGSSSSSSAAFLEMVAPKYAVITLGEDNRYGHPHKETIEAFEELGIEIFRTDMQGTIIATSNGGKVDFQFDLER